MPLNPPRLDDRTFDALVAELLARIPAHTPEWTHPRVGDPGRTLIELFAWLADSLLYRANLVPERQRLVFLKLLGIQLRPASPARGIVSVAFTRKDLLLPAATLRSNASVGGPPNFETRGELTVLPIAAKAYVKRLLDSQERQQLGPVIEDLKGVYHALHPETAQREPIPYVTSSLFEPADPQLDLITDTADQALWFALLAPTEGTRLAARTQLAAGQNGQPFVMNMGWVPALAAVETLDALPPRRPIAHVWEVTTAEMFQNQPVYRSLDVLRETSQGLTREGVLQLSLAAGSLGAPPNDTRINVDAGVGDQAPPRLDDPALERRLIAWLRMRPTESLSSLRVTWAGINAVEIEQAKTVTATIVGQSDGTTDQVVSLNETSIDATSLVLRIEEEESERFVTWQRVDDVHAYDRDARVFMLDAEAGTLRFGDGVRGRMPAVGRRIRVESMRAGGGAQGNLPANTLKTIAATSVTGEALEPLLVSQPLPTRGGADAEPLAEAERRIPASLRHRNRAITADDYRVLAANTPAVFVGRVEILPRFKPQQRRSEVPGVVSVMVLPQVRSTTAQAPAPRPDRPFLETVHAFLDERRSVGTELYVFGPEYVPLGVSVGVDIRAGFEREQTLNAVRFALRAFLWPLAPGGIRGQGWELGASVLAPALEVAVARVAGVSIVRGVRLFVRGDATWEPATTLIAPPSGGAGSPGARLQPWQLPELLSVVAVVGDAPEDLRGVPNPFRTGAVGLAIPVVPELC